MDVSVPEGFLVDVCFLTYDNFMTFNGSFDYIPAFSQMNVSHFSTTITMDPSIDVYDIVIVGHESNPGSPTVTTRLVQSHLPAQLLGVVQILQYVSICAAVFFFFLVALGYRENSMIRNPYVKARPRTKWNNFYTLSLVSTLALFVLQTITALILYWIVVGAG